MQFQTNTIVEHHNFWTLTKHLAGSVNKAAAKTDAVIYGTQTNVVVTPVPQTHPMRDTVGGIVIGLVLIGVCILFVCGKLRWRDLI